MDVQVEKIGPCEAKVRFTVPAAEAEAEYKQGLKNAAGQARMKGFRPGKVPPAMVEKMAGEAVARETVERFLRDAYTQAVEKEKLTPATHPRVSPDELSFEKGKDISHEFHLSLKPDFELGNYKGLAIEGQAVELEDGEVDKAIEKLRDQHAQPQLLGEEGVAGSDGIAVATVSFFHGEENVAERADVRLSAAHPPKGIAEDIWKPALEGAKAESAFELPMTFPDDYPREELRGNDGLAKIAVTQVYELIRPTEEELHQAFGVEDRAGLEEKFAEELTKSKEQAEHQRIESELLDQVIEAHQMPLPEPMLESQIEARRSQAANQLIQEGVSEADAHAQVDADAAGTRTAAEKSLRALFLVERIGEAEELKVSQDDLVAELRQIAQRNQASFDDVRKYYEENGLFQQLSVELLERKVRQLLRTEAKIS